MVAQKDIIFFLSLVAVGHVHAMKNEKDSWECTSGSMKKRTRYYAKLGIPAYTDPMHDEMIKMQIKVIAEHQAAREEVKNKINK